MTNRLSPHFTYHEMTHSDDAARHGFNNAPPADILENLQKTAYQMERVRKLLGDVPILVTSGYRSPQLNRQIGGHRASHHMLGWAVDFKCPQFGPPLEICRTISGSNIHYDQLIEEFGHWVHISFHPRGRKEDLRFSRNGYRVGFKR